MNVTVKRHAIGRRQHESNAAAECQSDYEQSERAVHEPIS
jgi:hypothetical protein